MNLSEAIVRSNRSVLVSERQPRSLLQCTNETTEMELVAAFGLDLATQTREAIQTFGVTLIHSSLVGLYGLKKGWRENIYSRPVR